MTLMECKVGDVFHPIFLNAFGLSRAVPRKSFTERRKGMTEIEATNDEERPLRIGRALREIRSILGITQEELAERADLSIHFLSRVENGKRGVSQQVAEAIAAVFEIPTSFLYLLAEQTNSDVVKDLQNTVLKAIQKKAQSRSNASCLQTI